MKKLKQRFADWRRERRIAAMARAVHATTSVTHAFELWLHMREEIMARSPQQVARMEQRMGLR